MMLGMDPAGTTGYAIYSEEDNQAYVFQYRGDPIQQALVMLETAKKFNITKVAFEKQHHFRNAKTVRDLFERYGYLKWTAISQGLEVVEVSPSPARKALGCKTKLEVFDLFVADGLTNNHTDALAVVLFMAGAKELPKIEVVTKGELE